MIDIPVVAQVADCIIKENKSKINISEETKGILLDYFSDIMRKDLNEEQPCPKCNHSNDLHKGLNNRCLICGCKNYME